MWGYPLSPLLFTLFALWFVVNTFWTRPGPSLIGALIVAAGVPVYFLVEANRRAGPGLTARLMAGALGANSCLGIAVICRLQAIHPFPRGEQQL